MPVEEIQRGIKSGVRKINIDTDIRLAMTGAMRKVFAELRPAQGTDRRHQGGTRHRQGALRGLRLRGPSCAHEAGVPGSHDPEIRLMRDFVKILPEAKHTGAALYLEASPEGGQRPAAGWTGAHAADAHLGFAKTRYRGLAKNANRALAILAMVNLVKWGRPLAGQMRPA